jgi:hypothetical protein
MKLINFVLVKKARIFPKLFAFYGLDMEPESYRKMGVNPNLWSNSERKSFFFKEL